MDDKAQSVISDWQRLNGDRGTYLTHCQDVTNYLWPERADYTVTRTPGAKRMQRVFDSTPLWALSQYVAGVDSLLTSSTLQWFGLRCDDDRIDSKPAVRKWLWDASTAMYAIFNGPRHNFAPAKQEIYGDLGSVGTGFTAVLESPKNGIIFSTRHIKECCIAENDEERVDTLIRRWEWTAKQAYQRWDNKCGALVMKAYEEKPDTKFAFLHAVRPRKNRNPERRDRLHMEFESLYVSEKDASVIDEGGFQEFPYLTPRHSKGTGELYGRGLGMIALPDVKMLNELMKLVVKSAQKLIDPPLMLPDDGFMVPIRTTPGALNFYRAGTRQYDRIAAIETGGQVQLGTDLLEGLRNQIIRTFFGDLLRMPSDLANPQGDGKGSTATYWYMRRDKEMMALGPMLSRHYVEFGDPLIDRVFNMMWRRSQAMNFGPGSPFPPPPPELSGQKLRVEYVSPIAMAQKSTQLDAITRLMQQQLALMQINPKAQVQLDDAAIMRLVANDLNAPPEALKSPEVLAQEAQAQAEAEAALNNHAAIANIAGAAKDGTAAMKNVADAQAAGTMQEAA
jgi:hypothetical protein